MQAIEVVKSGKIGKVLMAKAWDVQLRDHIGHKEDGPVPPGVDYETWLGPAPWIPFNENRFHYKWHWHWHFGTGDAGNDGAHQIDIARWALGAGYPKSASGWGRKVFFDEMGRKPGDRLRELSGTIADALLAPHLSYLAAFEKPLAEDLVHGMAHLTGGGFYDNIPRVLPGDLDVVVKAGSWPVLPVFEVIEREGRVSFEEMHRVFNMGIGMVVFVSASDLPRVAAIWTAARQRWYAIGNVKERGSRRVVIEPPPG